MTSTRRWNSHSDVKKHPDDSVLLAYLRGQKLETRSSVIQHIENEKCQVCFHRLNELEQVTNVLDVLQVMHSHQYYPELTVAETYARIESTDHQPISAQTIIRDGKYRQHPRKSALRWISVPVGVGLTIIFTAMLVFANLSGKALNPFSSHGHTNPEPNILTVVVSPHVVPTPQSNATATANATATDVVSSGATPEAQEPYIKVCSTKGNIAQLKLVICGFNFDGMHKAVLFFYVPGKEVFWLPNIPVDKHGKLHVAWNIANCGNMPIIIYGYEASGSKLIKVGLYITSFGACIAPTTPVVKPSQRSPKSGI